MSSFYFTVQAGASTNHALIHKFASNWIFHVLIQLSSDHSPSYATKLTFTFLIRRFSSSIRQVQLCPFRLFWFLLKGQSKPKLGPFNALNVRLQVLCDLVLPGLWCVVSLVLFLAGGFSFRLETTCFTRSKMLMWTSSWCFLALIVGWRLASLLASSALLEQWPSHESHCLTEFRTTSCPCQLIWIRAAMARFHRP